MAKWIIACKEINGQVFLNRLPQAIDDHTPGVPDIWHFVGPGSRPSVQEYSGDKFILTFDYLSHLYCRVVDTSIWPPTQVNPVQISGGPNPPTPFTYNIQLPQESLTIKTEGSTTFTLTQEFFNPPILKQPLLFLDVTTNTYSVTIQPVNTWVPIVSPGVTPFYRLYRRPIGTTNWVLVDDWQTSSTFVDSNVGSLRFDYSMTWGAQFLFTDMFNPNKHAEGIPGQLFITVDSNTQRPSFQFFLNEALTLDRSSFMVNGSVDTREAFLNEGPSDAIGLSRSSLGNGENTFTFCDVRQAFIHEAASDEIDLSKSALATGGNVLPTFMGT